jgi:hypothetical protein
VNNANGGAAIGHWAFTPMMVPVSAGTHTVAVVVAGTGSGVNANVGGDVNSVLQGILTTIVLTK